MNTILISTLATLAGKWQQQADSEMVTASEDARAAVRACADTLRMLCELRFEDCPHAAPHRYCAQCPVSPCPIGLDQPKAHTDQMRDAALAAPAQPAEPATLADDELLDIAADFRSQYLHGGTTFDEFDALGFARAVLAAAQEKP